MNKKISIYVAYHKKGELLETQYIRPIQVGARINRVVGSLTDDQGKSISDKNKNYCELTAQYWAWKNELEKYEYFGFMHYRRYFIFKKKKGGAEDIIDKLDGEAIREFGLTDRDIENAIRGYEIVMPRRWPVHPKDEWHNIMSIYDFYIRDHRKEDLDIAIDVINQIYPEYSLTLREVMHSKKAYFCNMFIMNKSYFEEYMTWLFNILFETEKRVKISEDEYQARVFGFLSERLINVFIEHVRKRDGLNIKELDVAFCRFTPEQKVENQQSFSQRLRRKLRPLKRTIQWLKS